jgi:hypothetical protein
MADLIEIKVPDIGNYHDIPVIEIIAKVGGVGVLIAFGSTHYFTAMQNVGRVKSLVDDLIMERGTVSMSARLGPGPALQPLGSRAPCSLSMGLCVGASVTTKTLQ